MKLNGLDLNKLNVFCSVVRHGGYKGASEELNLTRSAISQAIGSFEGTLGQTLFHRGSSKIVPTEQAIKFYREIIQYQNHLQNSVTNLLAEDGKVEGLLNVGAYLEFAKGKLMPLIESFMNKHPQAQIKFIFDSPSRLENLLESGRIDLSISIFPHRGIKSIKSQKLYQEELVLIGKSDQLPKSINKDFLKSVPIIDYYSNHLLYKRWWALHFDEKIPKIRPRSYGATAEMVYEMVRRGLGVGVVPKYIFENSSERRGLRIIQPTERKLVDFVWLNESQHGHYTTVHSAFHKTLFEKGI